MTRIAFIGDIAFVGKYDLGENKKAKLYFKKIASYLSQFDYVVGNLEGPLTKKKRTLICKSMHLKMNPVNIDLLKYLHINIVNLSNNHINDYGKQGIKDTISLLEKNEIEWFGLNGKTITKELDSKKIVLSGFCCYSTNGTNYGPRGLTPLTFDNIMKQLELDKENNAMSFINCHWGEEYTYYPKQSDIYLVQELAKKYSFNLIGHHAHIIQGISKINNCNICYNLGNFCFDDLFSINKKMFLEQKNYNKIGQILEYNIANSVLINRRIIDFTNNTLIVKDDEELTRYVDKLLIDFKDIKYSQRMKEQICNNRSEKFRKRDFKWLLSKLNYYSIGAYCLSKINMNKYKKVNFKNMGD